MNQSILARVAAWKVATVADPASAFSPEVAARAAQPLVIGNPNYTGAPGDPETVSVMASVYVAQVVVAGVDPADLVAAAVAAAIT